MESHDRAPLIQKVTIVVTWHKKCRQSQLNRRRSHGIHVQLVPVSGISRQGQAIKRKARLNYFALLMIVSELPLISLVMS